MRKPEPKPKSAMDALVDSFSELVEDARKHMSPEDFQKAEKSSTRLSTKLEPALLASGIVKPRNPTL
jgi:hypothetical protein